MTIFTPKQRAIRIRSTVDQIERITATRNELIASATTVADWRNANRLNKTLSTWTARLDTLLEDQAAPRTKSRKVTPTRTPSAVWGNRVYAAEASLPREFHRRGSITDSTKAVRVALEAAGIANYALEWRGDSSDCGGVAYYRRKLIRLGRKAQLHVAFHEAAHLIASDDRGHGQPFVTAYLGAVRAGVDAGIPGSLSLLRSLTKALRTQGFITSVGNNLTDTPRRD